MGGDGKAEGDGEVSVHRPGGFDNSRIVIKAIGAGLFFKPLQYLFQLLLT